MTVQVLQPNNTGQDTVIDSNNPATWNYGGRYDFSVGYSTNSTLQWRSLLRFDLSTVPAGVSLQSAVVSLYCYTEVGTNDPTINFHKALKQWYQGVSNGAVPGAGVDATTQQYRNYNGLVAWGANGGLSGTDYTSSATVGTLVNATNTWFNWNVTVDVASFLSGGSTNYGWFLIASAYASNNRKIFWSTEGESAGGADPTLLPKLTLTYNLINSYDSVMRGVGRGVMRGVK